MTRPNGVNTNYTYDGLSYLLSVLHQTGSTTLDGASYGYDYAGNRTSNTNHLNGITSSYGYDTIYELLNVTQAGSTTESYSYDAVGNRLSSSGVSSYSNNTSNELVSTSNGSYTYDANGNTLTDASGKSYTWDFENRMVSAVVPGTGTVTFKYDPFGRRVYKSSPTFTGIFAYDGYNLIDTMNSSGSIVAGYTQTQNIDEPLAERRSGGSSYYEADGLGSITSLSSSAGAVANSYTYDSFGGVTNFTGTLRNLFQYAGRESDSETGLYYNRARYYSPQSGRFVSEDPLGFASGATNFYGYVFESPTNLTDPLGLCGCTTPPAGPADPWGALDYYIHQAMETSANNDPTYSVPLFAMNSWNGGAYDPKSFFYNHNTYDPFGNYQRGAVCNASGYTLWQCQGGAGLVQAATDLLHWKWKKRKWPFTGHGMWPFIPPYWDRTNDSELIRRGWEYAEWKRRCSTQ